MKRFFLPLSIFCLITLFLVFTAFRAESSITPNKTNSVPEISTAFVNKEEIKDKAAAIEAASLKLYDSLQLNTIGLSKEAMMFAYKGQQLLVEQGKLSNSSILTICDFSQSSNNKRMYIIDVKNFKVLVNTYVAHGKNSGFKYAESFSNTPESLQSSLGFYKTTQTYHGKHGLSLRLAGLEKGINHLAEPRAIVVHGADYIGAHRSGAAYQGRSFGCPAVPRDIAPKVIQLIKNGSCLFVYKPVKSYLHGSSILNG